MNGGIVESSGAVFSYKLVEMDISTNEKPTIYRNLDISTNEKPTIYRNLYENTAQVNIGVASQQTRGVGPVLF